MAGKKSILAARGSKGDSKRLLKDTFFILMGIFAAAFGLESFLLPNVFIDGGVTGISLLVSEVTAAPLWILIVLINLPFIFMGYKVIGKQFALKTAVAILGLALTLVLIQFPEVTQDKLLVAVFGGFFLGAGIGLSIRGGSVLDGTEVLAIFLSRKWGVKIGDIIILVNVIIFLAAAYLLSIEAALYSMLTYLAASKTLDFVVEGIEEYTGVTIISKQSEEIRKMIVEKMGRGLTIYEAKGGYGSQGEQNEYNVIYTVITRLEIRKLHNEI
ncbi:MAG: YitT family protein, partial [Allomuricauda sp.]